ncbi:hypothetical protein BZG35_03495 [Brevundimonas sp. LM2]|nr:hypothetical protein BZG35_03495 [Brevundimonas sp. LM2]
MASKAKGIAAIAARLGVSKRSARTILASDSFPVGRRGESNLVSDRHLQAYRHQLQAIPAWEGEGGALYSHSRIQNDDHA